MPSNSAPETFNLVSSILDNIMPLLYTAAGSFLGFFIARWQHIFQKKTDFIEKQISDFYSPMVSIIKEIRGKNELRVEISKTADKVWKKECEIPFSSSEVRDKAFEQYDKIITYDITQLKNELLPKYRKMLEIFIDKYWLATIETRHWLEPFINFIEIWNRYEDGSLPIKVTKELDYEEKHVKPFYVELENTMNKLIIKLK